VEVNEWHVCQFNISKDRYGRSDNSHSLETAKGAISMQIEVRDSWQGVVFQQDLSAKEIELTDTELATIYGGADQPVVQQQFQQQVGPATTPSQQQQTTADPLPLPQEVNHTINLVGGRDLSLN
jgi:bacteriocin-like protein